MPKLFTETFLRNLRPKAEKYYVREGRGFWMLVRPSGAKSFVYQFELNKVRGMITLGQYLKDPELPGHMTLSQARLEFEKQHALVKSGVDPRTLKAVAADAIIQEREEKRATEEAEASRITLEEQRTTDTFDSLTENGIPDGYVPLTLEQLYAVYHTHYSLVNHGDKTIKSLLYTVKKDLFPAVGHIPITEFTRPAAIELLRKVAENRPAQAETVLQAGRQMYEFALDREWVKHQPFLRIKKAVKNIGSEVDDRTLNDEEIRQFWTKVEQCNTEGELKRALKLILVTAQRPGEVCQLQRSQISGNWWTIPKTIAKNEREHRVYLTDTALALIGDADGYIFPSIKDDRDYIGVQSLSEVIRRSRPNNGDNMVSFERESLYTDVWASPLSALSEKFGISDVAIRKVCLKLNIPIPGRSYWGSKVKPSPTPLPQDDGSIEKHTSIQKEKTPVVPYFGFSSPWRPHDLRRTARTNMERIEVPERHAEEVINHKPPKMVGVYNKHSYDRQKKVAMLRWEAFLSAILNNREEEFLDYIEKQQSMSDILPPVSAA